MLNYSAYVENFYLLAVNICNIVTIQLWVKMYHSRRIRADIYSNNGLERLNGLVKMWTGLDTGSNMGLGVCIHRLVTTVLPTLKTLSKLLGCSTNVIRSRAFMARCQWQIKKECKELRIRLTAKYKKHNIKGHIGKLENYQFNKTLERERLSAVANGEMDSVTSMTAKDSVGQVNDATKPHLFWDLVLANTNTSKLFIFKSIMYIMEFEIFVSWSLLLLPTTLKLLNNLRLTNTWQPLGVNECEHRSLHTALLCSTGIDISIQ